MGRRLLRNKQSGCVVNLSGSKQCCRRLLLHCHNRNEHGRSKMASSEHYLQVYFNEHKIHVLYKRNQGFNS